MNFAKTSLAIGALCLLAANAMHAAGQTSTNLEAAIHSAPPFLLNTESRNTEPLKAEALQTESVRAKESLNAIERVAPASPSNTQEIYANYGIYLILGGTILLLVMSGRREQGDTP